MSRSVLPWWLTPLDAVCVCLPLLTAVVFVTGGFRIESDALFLSMTGWQRLLAWSVAALTLRHLLVGRPSLLDRLAGAYRAGTARFRAPLDVLALGAGSRLAVLLVGYLAIVILRTASEASPFTAAWNAWNPPDGSETWRHIALAEQGYPRAYFPGAEVFPALGLAMRLTGWLLPLSPLAAGTVIAVGAFTAALAYLSCLARQDLDDEARLVSMALLAAYPWAVVHSLIGVEPLYLLAALGAFHHLRRDQPLRAAAWGTLLGLTRPAGILMVLPLALVAWSPPAGRGQGRPRRLEGPALPAGPRPLSRNAGEGPLPPGRRLVALLPAASPVLGVALALAYAGSPTLLFGTMPNGSLGLLDVLPLAAAFALARPVARRFGVAYAAFIAVELLASVLFTAESAPGPHSAVLFPLFLWLGAAIPASQRFAWVGVFALLQGLASVLLFAGGGSW